MAKYEPSERRGEVAKLLIDHGTDIKKVDRQGRTPLIAASDSGFADIVKLLVHKISDEDRQEYLDYKKHFSWTALMCASEKGHTEVVRILIMAGASRSLTKDKDEVSALHIAVQNGHVEVIEALTHKMDKPDLNARDNYGMTPLILASKRRSEQIINVLIHAGADVDAQSTDEDQMTALMFAVKVGSFDVVKLLVENSANPLIKNSKKETVLEMAKRSSKEIQDYLSEKCKLQTTSCSIYSTSASKMFPRPLFANVSSTVTPEVYPLTANGTSISPPEITPLRVNVPSTITTTRTASVSATVSHIQVPPLTATKITTEPSIQLGHKTRLTTKQHYSSLCDALDIYATKWRDIGRNLQFSPGELNNIEAKPTLLQTAPKSYLHAMLEEWLQWAPGDSRGSENFATLEALKLALRKSNLGATGADLRII